MEQRDSILPREKVSEYDAAAIGSPASSLSFSAATAATAATAAAVPLNSGYVVRAVADEVEELAAHVVEVIKIQRELPATVDVKVVEIPPEVVFPEPPKPAALIEQERLQEAAAAAAAAAAAVAAAESTTLGEYILQSLLPSAILAISVWATAAWLWRRERAHRRSFSLQLDRFCENADEAMAESTSSTGVGVVRDKRGGGSVDSCSTSLGDSVGGLRDRVQEADRRLAELRELIAEGYELDVGFTWRAGTARRKREVVRRFETCKKGLPRRLAAVEGVAKELRVMAEMEQLLGKLDRGTREGSSSTRHRGRQGTVGEDRQGPVRLLERAELLLEGSDHLSSDDDGTGCGVSCVFRDELRGWCDTLAAKEQVAKDQLEFGLVRWDLARVDHALAQLRLLEVPEIVQDGEGRREVVRRKRLKWREDLETAKGSARRGNDSLLRRACVKAENKALSSVDDEYYSDYCSAEQFLQKLLSFQLEVKARRLLESHGFQADPCCNSRLDLACGPTILIKGAPAVAMLALGHGDDLSTRTIMAADATHSTSTGVGRQLFLLPSGHEVEERAQSRDHNHLGGEGGVDGGGNPAAAVAVTAAVLPCINGGDTLGEASDGGDSSDRQITVSTDASFIGGSADSSEDCARTTWEASYRREGSTGEIGQHQHQQSLSLRQMQSLRGVQANFLACVTQQEEEHRRARDRDQADLEAQEAEEHRHNEHITRLDASGAQEEERRAMESRRLQREEEWRRRKHEKQLRDEEDRKRGADRDRLEKLWARDGEFFRILSSAASLAAAVFSFGEGFSFDPGAILDGAWKVVVAECAAQGEADDGATDASPVSSVEGVCTTLGGRDEGSCGAGSADGADYGAGADAGGAAGGGSEVILWWVWSTAQSSLSAALGAGYSSTRWLLAQTVGRFAPAGLQCEIGAALWFCVELFFLALAMKIAGTLLGWGGGRRFATVGAAVQWILLAAWVCERFLESIQHVGWELLLSVVPAPVVVFSYGWILSYVERHRTPDGHHWVRGWDVRIIWSRLLPLVAAGVMAYLLGARASWRRAKVHSS